MTHDSTTHAHKNNILRNSKRKAVLPRNGNYLRSLTTVQRSRKNTPNCFPNYGGIDISSSQGCPRVPRRVATIEITPTNRSCSLETLRPKSRSKNVRGQDERTIAFVSHLSNLGIPPFSPLPASGSRPNSRVTLARNELCRLNTCREISSRSFGSDQLPAST